MNQRRDMRNLLQIMILKVKFKTVKIIKMKIRKSIVKEKFQTPKSYNKER